MRLRTAEMEYASILDFKRFGMFEGQFYNQPAH